MRLQGNPVLRSCRLVMCCTLLTLTSAVHAQSQRADEPTDGAIFEEIVVEETAGAVKIKFDNRWQSPSTGMTVSLPATVSTGADGSIRIRQAATVISVASSTAIELLEGAEPGAPLQRVVQNQGSAFYDIAPQGSSRLRVETPYLVAVIKGTEFNVTVAAETSTIALFEGRLQVEAPDVGDVVELHQGQIAKRHKNDPRITVLSMQDGEPVARGDGGPSGAGTASGDEGDDGVGTIDRNPVDGGDGNVAAGGDASGVDHGLAANEQSDLDQANLKAGGDAMVDLSAGELAIGLDGDLDAGLDVGLDLDDVDLNLTIDAVVGIGDSNLDLGIDAGLDIAGSNIEAELDVGLGLGDSVVNLGMDVGLDLDGGSIDLGLDGDIDLGSVSADIGLDAGVDLAGGDIDLGMDADLGLGGVGVDAGLDAGMDLDDGGIDAVVDAGIDLGDTALDAGLDVGVDLGGEDAVVGGAVDLDVAGVGVDIGASIDLGDLGNILDVDLGLDLGLLGGGNTDSDSDGIEEDGPADLPINPRDLFDLLRL